MEKLPEDFKKKWISALRSGEYKQGKYTLLSEGGSRCCLGVAAAVVGIENGSIMNKAFIGCQMSTHANIKEYPEALKWTESQCIAKVLSRMNDTENLSFSEIADYIEANL